MYAAPAWKGAWPKGEADTSDDESGMMSSHLFYGCRRPKKEKSGPIALWVRRCRDGVVKTLPAVSGGSTPPWSALLLLPPPPLPLFRLLRPLPLLRLHLLRLLRLHLLRLLRLLHLPWFVFKFFCLFIFFILFFCLCYLCSLSSSSSRRKEDGRGSGTSTCESSLGAKIPMKAWDQNHAGHCSHKAANHLGFAACSNITGLVPKHPYKLLETLLWSIHFGILPEIWLVFCDHVWGLPFCPQSEAQPNWPGKPNSPTNRRRSEVESWIRPGELGRFHSAQRSIMTWRHTSWLS